MRLLLLLIVAMIKCSSGRSIQDHLQSLPSYIQKEKNLPSSLLKNKEFKEISDLTSVQNHEEFKSSLGTNIESYNKIHAIMYALQKLIMKSKDIYPNDAVGRSSLSNNNPIIKSENNMPFLKSSDISSSNGSPTGSFTTTLDPWDEFCKEACEEGLAGPECDCPEYPIG